MKTDIDDSRVIRFDREFANISRREYWLTLYLQLRKGGDDHDAASETIRMEMQMERLAK